MSELKIWVEDCVPVDLTMKSVSGGNLGMGGLRTPLILIDSSMESSIVSWFLSTEADSCMSDEKLVTGKKIKKTQSPLAKKMKMLMTKGNNLIKIEMKILHQTRNRLTPKTI